MSPSGHSYLRDNCVIKPWFNILKKNFFGAARSQRPAAAACLPAAVPAFGRHGGRFALRFKWLGLYVGSGFEPSTLFVKKKYHGITSQP
jgi:hypothetical protein